MGDNMRHFWDVNLLSFSHHPKSVLTLYPPLHKDRYVHKEAYICNNLTEDTNLQFKY